MASLKKSKTLKEIAVENARVTKGTFKEQKVLKEGVPNEHHTKQGACKQSEATVGVNLGVTKNMDNFESLRVDVWASDIVQSGETIETAYERVLGVVDRVLQDTVKSYAE